ncbi:MAG: glycosyltransferase [Gemmataceae bacterium]
MASEVCDLSVVVSFHAEGVLAHRTLRSVLNAVDHARQQGMTVELIAILDAATPATRHYFARYRNDPGLRIEEVDYRNCGEPRNHGIRLARGRWLAILDGDDLIMSTWLHRACARGEEFKGQHVVLAHECSLVFDARHQFMSHPGSADAWFQPEVLLESNYWNTPALVAPRELLLDLPYRATPAREGFCYEDWQLFMEFLARGVPIVTVPESILFVRRKAVGSVLQAYLAEEGLLPPTSFLHPLRFGKAGSPVPALQHESAAAAHEPVGPRLLVRMGLALARRFPLFRPFMVRAYHTLYRRGLLRNSVRKPPQWVIQACRAIGSIEPLIRADDEFWSKVEDYRVPPPHSAKAYATLCAHVGGAVGHLFLVPWLKTGGADLEALNYVRVAVEQGTGSQAIVVATDDDLSPWADRLPAGVTFIPFSRIAGRLDQEAQRRLLATFLVQLGPAVIHNLNSRLGYEVFVRHGRALKQVARLFTSAFCLDYSAGGGPVGYLVDYLPHCAESLSGIFADNQHVIRWLRDTYGYDQHLLHLHYQPAHLRAAERREASGELQVLWAARLDRQKRPDILAEVARRAQELPVHFHVYGSPVLRDSRKSERFSSAPNLTFHGPFDGFEDLPTERFDLFLNTSQWEGLPNVLLEALACGRPVLSSDVGGIGELILHGETGLLVSPFDDVDGYVRELAAICADRGQLARLAERGHQLVAERHSWQGFRRAVEQVPGYLEPRGALRPVESADERVASLS